MKKTNEINDVINAIVKQVKNDWIKAPMGSNYYNRCCNLTHYKWDADGWYNGVIDEDLDKRFSNLILDLRMWGDTKTAKNYKNILMKKIIEVIKDNDNVSYVSAGQDFKKRIKAIAPSMTDEDIQKVYGIC